MCAIMPSLTAYLDQRHLGWAKWDVAVVDHRNGHSLWLSKEAATVGTDELAQEVSTEAISLHKL